MPRKYIRKFSKVGAAKWSHENKGCLITFTADQPLINGLYQSGSNIVPATNVQGTRTVGNFTITLPVPANQNASEIFWALVFIPQGTAANNLFSTTGSVEGSLYEPNQFVIASGVSDNSAGPIRIRTTMKRTLHSNDAVSLILGSSQKYGTDISIRALVSYSIKYN